MDLINELTDFLDMTITREVLNRNQADPLEEEASDQSQTMMTMRRMTLKRIL